MLAYFKEQGIKGKEFDAEVTNYCRKIIALKQRYNLQDAPILHRPTISPISKQPEDITLLTLANLPLVDVSKNILESTF